MTLPFLLTLSGCIYTGYKNLITSDYNSVAQYRAPEEKKMQVPFKENLAHAIWHHTTCIYVRAAKVKELSQRTNFIQIFQQVNSIVGDIHWRWTVLIPKEQALYILEPLKGLFTHPSFGAVYYFVTSKDSLLRDPVVSLYANILWMVLIIESM
jgi:hypothetical protein